MFSNAQVIEASRAFVPAADETWRLQHGDDAEARLFRTLVGQGADSKGGGTRQGIYIVAPGGALLASANVLQADKALDLLARGLAAWEALPDSARLLAEDTRAALRSAETAGARWESSCPLDGLVLEQFSRDLPPDGDPAAAPLPPVQRDHAWFSRAEARRLLPDEPRVGDTHEVPAALVARLARFHFVDAVRGQVQPFAPGEVSGALRAAVVARDGDVVDLLLSGETGAVARGPWLMGENAWKWPGEHPRSVHVTLSGRARFDLADGAFTRFELLARGTRRGSSGLNGRQGDTDEGPIGFWLQLAGRAPADRVAPAFVDVYDADFIVRPAPARAPASDRPATQLLRRMAVIGASVSYGINLRASLADALDALIALPHEAPLDGALGNFSVASMETREQVVQRAAEREPSALIAVDFLFWFAYGFVPEQQRVARIDVALAMLDSFECPVVIGLLPALQPLEPVLQWNPATPSRETLLAINQRISDWAARRPHVVLVPLVAVLDDLQHGRPLAVGPWSWPASSPLRFMQPDGTHPTEEGLLVLARLVVESLRAHFPALQETDFIAGLPEVRRRMLAAAAARPFPRAHTR